jgi:outer membrane protein assembly factor BamB
VNPWQNLFIRILFCFLILDIFAAENDWTNWLGPNHNGYVEGNLNLSSNPNLNDTNVLWQNAVGAGWSSPIVSGQKVFLHDRTGKKENLTAYSLSTGKVIWRVSFDSQYRDDFGMENGPRSTPAVSHDIVVTHSPQGLVHAFDGKTGGIRWIKDLSKEFNSAKGFFGRCSSPLILDEKVIFDVGGSSVGLVALSLKMGDLIWASKVYGNDYSSVTTLRKGATQLAVAFMRQGLVVVDASNGKEVFFDRFQSPINASVNAASPLILENGIFLSSCYEVGAGYWNFTSSDQMINFTNKWKRKGLLDCHYSTPVAKGDYLFGFHGRQERGANLRCIKLSDGEVQWTQSIRNGHLIGIGEQILCLSEKGEFTVFDATPVAFKPVLQQQVLGQGRAHFAYSNGKIIARDNRRLICLDLFSEGVWK